MTASGFPVLRQIVLDTTDARGLAEFYRELLGYAYRAGDEAPPAGEDDPRGRDWLVLDRSDDPAEQLFVYADPDGHPFCIFVAPG